MNSASDLVDFARRNIDERGMRIEKDGEDAVKLVDKDRGVVLAKFKSVDDMIESYGPKTPDLNFGNADNYIAAVNPEANRVAESMTLRLGDMEGMLPQGATRIKSEGGVTYYKDGPDFYATAYNPNIDEEDVIGYHLAKDGASDLQVIEEMQGKGIGGELSYLFRRNNPEAPSGGFTEAGERTARKTYDRLKAEGIVSSPAPVGAAAGLLASEAATPEGQLNPLLAVPAEIGSALNEAVVGTLDFIGPDTINAVSQMAGSDFRVPRLSDQELVQMYTQGGYMSEGVPRDAVRTATGLLSPL